MFAHEITLAWGAPAQPQPSDGPGLRTVGAGWLWPPLGHSPHPPSRGSTHMVVCASYLALVHSELLSQSWSCRESEE